MLVFKNIFENILTNGFYGYTILESEIFQLFNRFKGKNEKNKIGGNKAVASFNC